VEYLGACTYSLWLAAYILRAGERSAITKFDEAITHPESSLLPPCRIQIANGSEEGTGTDPLNSGD